MKMVSEVVKTGDRELANLQLIRDLQKENSKQANK